MTKHAFLPTTIFSNTGSAFVSQVIKEVADVLGITLAHATIKHPETIDMLERTHYSPKKAPKNEIGERRSMWHILVNIAVLTTTRPTTQPLSVNLTECSSDVFRTMRLT